MGALNFFVNEKAILEILDLREIEEVKKQPPPHADGSPGATLSMTDLSRVEALTSAVGDFSASSDFLEQTILGSGVQNLSSVTLRGAKKQFEVQFIPTFFVLKNAEVTAQRTGVFSKGEMLELLEK